MVTTAARSRDYMRKLGYIAECVEHRRGNFIRIDLFQFADVMAFKANEGIILIQAYRKDTAALHNHMDENHPMIKTFLEAGGFVEHHIWSYTKKGERKKWTVERKLISKQPKTN
jgi:hypothetical protein